MTLEGRALACAYGPTPALRDVSFSARPGVLAVFGPNGAGKSTLLRVLAGERRPDRGGVFLDGVAVTADLPAWRSRIGVVGHRTGLYAKLTVAENLAFFASLYGRAARGRAREALAAAGAEDLADRPAERLSRGQRQRAALSRALLRDPDVLLLDEPFTGLDAAAAAALAGTLRERGRCPRIVVLATHDLAHGTELADRVIVLCRGRKALDCRAGKTSSPRIMDAMSGRRARRGPGVSPSPGGGAGDRPEARGSA